MTAIPKLSVVVPVYNEEAVLPTLFARLYPALDALEVPYEIVHPVRVAKCVFAHGLKSKEQHRRSKQRWARSSGG